MKKIVFILATILLLAGCGGGATSSDPFVGTWKDAAEPDVWLVIEKQDDSYKATIYKYGKVDPVFGMTSLVFSRDGRHLVGKEYPKPTNGQPNGFVVAPDADLSTSGHLYFSPFGMGVDLTRSSPTSWRDAHDPASSSSSRPGSVPDHNGPSHVINSGPGRSSRPLC